MSELDELKMETQTLYDDYLMATEKRGISWGEVAYIQGLSRKELDDFCKELENEIKEKELKMNKVYMVRITKRDKNDFDIVKFQKTKLFSTREKAEQYFAEQFETYKQGGEVFDEHAEIPTWCVERLTEFVVGLLKEMKVF